MTTNAMGAFRVAYDGEPFHGFQRQPDVRTVEGVLLSALHGLDVLDAESETPPGYAAAGRTDAGVSALAQTVAFEAPAWLTPAVLNGELPASVRAWARADAPAGFHATHAAAARTYTYYHHAPETRAVAGNTAEPGARPDANSTETKPDASTTQTNTQRARAALTRLAGEHDFHNLTPDDRGTVRDLETGLDREGAFLVLELRADGFPRQLVRRIVSLVAAIAAGEAPLSKVDRVLDAEALPGPEGVGPAPPTGLVLADVAYPGLDFHADRKAVESARAVFEERRSAAATAARVAEAVADGIDS